MYIRLKNLKILQSTRKNALKNLYLQLRNTVKRILCRLSEFTRLTGINMKSHRNPCSSSYASVIGWEERGKKVFYCFCADTFLTKFSDYATWHLAHVNTRWGRFKISPEIYSRCIQMCLNCGTRFVFGCC